jgi:alkyldihydroxyacetonephosphate synthase
MKRWNGWGNPAISYPLPDQAAKYLEERLGRPEPEPDAGFESVVASVPASQFPDHPLVSRQAGDRLLHARGQSLPDWVDLRAGEIDRFPDGVAHPRDEDQLRCLMDLAAAWGAHLIPYGGGTSVVGHINPLPSDGPLLTIDLQHLNRLLALDEISRLATFEAGVSGPQLEAALHPHGYTLGHYPQSFEYSTLGGWIATRSSGQQSYHYGRIEDLFAGGRVLTPAASLDLPVHPASAAGPDLRQVFLGSEGRYGIITRAVVRVHRIPEVETFHGVLFPDWLSGADAVREIAQAGIGLSMLRLSDAEETAITMLLSGKARLSRWAAVALRPLGFGSGRCLLIYGLTGLRTACHAADRQARQIFRAYGGLHTGAIIGRTWRKSRFYTPYLRNTLWDTGFAVDTLESAFPWSQALPAARAIIEALRSGLQESGEAVHAFGHLSHVYPDGASVYITYIFQRRDPESTRQSWLQLKQAASRIIIRSGGTISHQHGVGSDHLPYLQAEKGALGLEALRSLGRSFDPNGLLNPGKLYSG